MRSILKRIHQTLSVAEAGQPSEVLFVLAGGRQRKIYGLELYAAGLAPQILLSVGRFEIRRFSELALPYPADVAPIDLLAAAQALPPLKRHFFVAFDHAGAAFEPIAAARLGTLREIRALAKWCGEHTEITSLTIVSSGYHLRRVRLCCLALLPGRIRVNYVAAPEQPAPDWRDLLLELVKLPTYALILKWRGW